MLSARFFYAIGRGLDWVRKFLHLIFLLLLFGFVVGALRVSSPWSYSAKAALVIAPEGEIVEQLSGDPIERAIDQARGNAWSETLLRDLTDSIRAAAEGQAHSGDGAGHGVLLRRRPAHARRALRRPLLSFARPARRLSRTRTAYEKAQYYLAAQADEIYVDPLGMVLIDGYEAYHMFYKGALDKVGVDINIFPCWCVQERGGALQPDGPFSRG